MERLRRNAWNWKTAYCRVIVAMLKGFFKLHRIDKNLVKKQILVDFKLKKKVRVQKNSTKWHWRHPKDELLLKSEKANRRRQVSKMQNVSNRNWRKHELHTVTRQVTQESMENYTQPQKKKRQSAFSLSTTLHTRHTHIAKKPIRKTKSIKNQPPSHRGSVWAGFRA